MTEEEKEVHQALFAYKMALIHTGYRSWWHRLLSFLEDDEARAADATLTAIESQARKIVNSTKAHQAACRVISAQQPEYVMRMDNFLALLDLNEQAGHSTQEKT